MRQIVLSMLLMFYFSQTCLGQEGTQTNLTQKYGDDAKASMKTLDSVYKRILKIYSKDSIFIRNIKLTQSAWLNYFKLQQRAMFPDYPSANYGSSHSMCASQYGSKLIKERIAELTPWLVGREDGDCFSSVLPKDDLPSQ